MKTELEQKDIDSIAQRVVELIKPLLSGNSEPSDPGTIFDVEGLSEYLEVSKKWVYERVQYKEIPHLKLNTKKDGTKTTAKNGALRFRKSAIDKWLSSYDVPVSNSAEALKRVI